MNIVLLVIFLILVICIAGLIVSMYMNISNKKVKKIISIVFWCILIVCLIVLITFLCHFFNLLAQVQPL